MPDIPFPGQPEKEPIPWREDVSVIDYVETDQEDGEPVVPPGQWTEVAAPVVTDESCFGAWTNGFDQITAVLLDGCRLAFRLQSSGRLMKHVPSICMYRFDGPALPDGYKARFRFPPGTRYGKKARAARVEVGT